MISRRGFLSSLPVFAGGLGLPAPTPLSPVPLPAERPADGAAASTGVKDLLVQVFTEIERAYAHNGDDACLAVLARLCPSYRCHRCPLRWTLWVKRPLLPVEPRRLANRTVIMRPLYDYDRQEVYRFGSSALVAAAWWLVQAGERLALHTPTPQVLLLELLGAPPLCPRKLAAGQLDANEWMLICRRAQTLSKAKERLLLLPEDAPLGPGYWHLGQGWRFLHRAAAEADRFVAVVAGNAARIKPKTSLAVFQLTLGRPLTLVSPWQLRWEV